jgi:hypothetical protein
MAIAAKAISGPAMAAAMAMISVHSDSLFPGLVNGTCGQAFQRRARLSLIYLKDCRAAVESDFANPITSEGSRPCLKGESIWCNAGAKAHSHHGRAS